MKEAFLPNSFEYGVIKMHNCYGQKMKRIYFIPIICFCALTFLATPSMSFAKSYSGTNNLAMTEGKQKKSQKKAKKESKKASTKSARSARKKTKKSKQGAKKAADSKRD